MSVVIGFPQDVQIATSAPSLVQPSDTWLSVPAVYAVPFGYKGNPGLVENWAKDVWIKLRPEQIIDVEFSAGNTTITFSPESGIISLKDDDPNKAEVVMQGFDTTTITGNRTATQIVIPQSYIYSVDVDRIELPPGFILPVPFSSPTDIAPIQTDMIQGQIGSTVQDPVQTWRSFWGLSQN